MKRLGGMTDFGGLLGMTRGVLTSGSPLAVDLTHYWSLEESTGTRADAIGSDDLAMSGTVSGATGKNGDAAVFNGTDANYLAGSSATATHPTGNFSLNVWIKPTTVANAIIACKGYPTLGAEWRLQLFGGGFFRFSVSADGTNFAQATLGAGTITGGVWSMVTAWWDGTDIKLSVNDGTPTTAAFAGPVFDGSGTPDHSTTRLGTNPAGLGDTYDGAIDELGFWQRDLEASEITELYAAGSGLFYPF